MSTSIKLPSEWQLGDQVQVVFPNNGKLQGKIVKVSFAEHSEPLYDVEIPFTHWDFNGEPEPDSEDAKTNKTGFFRIHGLRQWFISYTQEEWDKIQKDDASSMSTKLKVGDKVHRDNEHGKIENGMVKSVESDSAFVVYNCDDDWDHFEEYTATRTRFIYLSPGWINDIP